RRATVMSSTGLSGGSRAGMGCGIICPFDPDPTGPRSALCTHGHPSGGRQSKECRFMGELAREILPVNIEDEMKLSYLDYAMSVIVGRALPDVRDGLKPVHRRVLFAMRELTNDWNKPYLKSAPVLGDVIGTYH